MPPTRPSLQPDAPEPAGGRIERALITAWSNGGLLAALLVPAGWLVGALARARRWAYRRGHAPAHRAGRPVVVVGNLVVGGAGKTPVVVALVEALRRAGHRPGLVSRGHGRTGDASRLVNAQTPATLAGDEPLLVVRRTGVPAAVGRDRVAAARLLVDRHPEITVIVADDGLQHRRLARDVEVVVFDERGIGNGRCLPAGPLREPLMPVPPPRTVVLYNAPAATTPWAGVLLGRRLAGAVALQAWHRGEPARPETLQALRGRPLLAAAGTARPARFFEMLAAEGLEPARMPLPDHFRFDQLPWPPDTPDVIVTEKDAVKLDAAAVGATRVWVAPLDCDVPDDAVAAVLAALPAP
jgi:tetraacyldisaccharide 4'-kinase